MTSSWLFTSNVFRLLAERSLQRFFKFCYLLMGSLQSNSSDAFFNEKHHKLLPSYTAFDQAYDLKFGHKALRKSETKKFYQLLKQLSGSKSHAWDVAIQNVYLNTNPEYTKILPQGLTPLSTLPIEQRIKYIGNAVTQLSNVPELATLHLEIKGFYKELLEARDAQEQKGANVKSSTDDVMQKAYLLADEIYGVLGEFMAKFKSNPTQIGVYFPIFLLRYKKKTTNENPDLYEIVIDEGAKVEGGFSFKISDKINLYNTGETELEAFFTDGKDALKPSNTIKILPQDIKTILIKDYANQEDRFLMIENLSPTDKGEIEISFV